MQNPSWYYLRLFLIAGVVVGIASGKHAGGSADRANCEIPSCKLAPSQGAAGDRFGGSVSLSGSGDVGDVLVVGAHTTNLIVIDDDGDELQFTAAGSAYVYRFDGIEWVEESKLESSDPPVAFDFFGSSVSATDDAIVVGAFTANDDLVSFFVESRDRGAAYIFRDNVSGWEEEAKLQPRFTGIQLTTSGSGYRAGTKEVAGGSGTGLTISIQVRPVRDFTDSDGDGVRGDLDWCPNSVACSPPTGRFGACPPPAGFPVGTPNFMLVEGCAEGETGVQPTGFDFTDQDGDGVSGTDDWCPDTPSGALLVMGCSLEDFASGVAPPGEITSGAIVDRGVGYKTGEIVTIVEEGRAPGESDDGTFTLTGPPILYDHFGRGVAISGDAVVVGAPGDDSTAIGAGVAYVFRDNGFDWVEEALLLASDGEARDEFGRTVAISGNVIVVAAVGADAGGAGSGAASVYRDDGMRWVEEQKLVASDAVSEHYFGQSVSVSGDVIVVGANGDANAGALSGAAYVYRFNGTSWIEEQKLVASDAAGDDRFGGAVSLSASGDTIAIGAIGNRHAGLYSGATYLYRFDGAQWVEDEKLVAVDAAEARFFGSAVAAADDTTLVGATGDVPAGGASGSVYVFD